MTLFRNTQSGIRCVNTLKKERVEFVQNKVKKHLGLKLPILTNPAPVQLVDVLMKYLKPQSKYRTFSTFTDSRKLKM